jgi:hypothetical protein
MENDYPVYAIPGAAGATLIRDLSHFSDRTNITAKSNSSEGFAIQPKSDRLFARLDLGMLYILIHSKKNLYLYI